jgi:hypothetical protein
MGGPATAPHPFTEGGYAPSDSPGLDAPRVPAKPRRSSNYSDSFTFVDERSGTGKIVLEPSREGERGA